MITTVLVRYGKPVLSLPYRAIQLIGLLAVTINVVMIIYVFELFSIAYHIKYHLSDFLTITYSSFVSLPMLTTIAGLLTIPANVLNVFSIYKAFFGKKQIYRMMLFVAVGFGFLLVVVLCVLVSLVLMVGYDVDPQFKKAMLNSMKNYSTDGILKMKIDKMQFELQCCGTSNYTDWYDIDWYDTNFVQKVDVPLDGEAPYSCCSIHSINPCIHHGVESGAGPYKYTIESNFSLSPRGCSQVLQERKVNSSWHISGYIACLILLQISATIPLRLVQTAHMERGRIDKENHLYTSWLFGCYAGKKRTPKRPPPPVPPMSPTLMN